MTGHCEKKNNKSWHCQKVKTMA